MAAENVRRLPSKTENTSISVNTWDIIDYEDDYESWEMGREYLHAGQDRGGVGENSIFSIC